LYVSATISFSIGTALLEFVSSVIRNTHKIYEIWQYSLLVQI